MAHLHDGPRLGFAVGMAGVLVSEHRCKSGGQLGSAGCRHDCVGTAHVTDERGAGAGRDGIRC